MRRTQPSHDTGTVLYRSVRYITVTYGTVRYRHRQWFLLIPYGTVPYGTVQLSFRSTIPKLTKWLMGAMKLVGKLPPLALPEYDLENLPDIEEDESPLPPGAGSIPLVPTTAEGADAIAEREQHPPPPKHRKPKPPGFAASTTTSGSLPDLTEDSHATFKGPSSCPPLPSGL